MEACNPSLNWPLNWKELHGSIEALRPRLLGQFLDQVIIPVRLELPHGFQKGEWGIRLQGSQGSQFLWLCLRPGNPFLVLTHGKGPKAAQTATHTIFDLSLSKQLSGHSILSIDAFPGERILRINFKTSQNLSLILNLIPQTPEGLLVQNTHKGLEVLASTRPTEKRTFFEVPKKPDSSVDLPIRMDLSDPDALYEARLIALKEEAFLLRKQRLEKHIRGEAKPLSKRIAQAEVTLKTAHEEPDWKHYGDLLKANLHLKPQIQFQDKKPGYELEDYLTQEKVFLPATPELPPTQQIQKYYHLYKRKEKRLEESNARLEMLKERKESLNRFSRLLKEALDLETILSLESQLGLENRKTKQTSKRKVWSGKTFISKTGQTIWVGRNRTENLELTLQIAKGNDIWMHVKGRPSAHVVIPLEAKKTASLETLLDGALLCLHYSGGNDWGKTEIDYTFRKHVKRIKGSNEVIYTQNKTLVVEQDPERIITLLGSKT